MKFLIITSHRWINRDDIDFSVAERLPPVQEWELQPENVGGTLEYPTQVRAVVLG